MIFIFINFTGDNVDIFDTINFSCAGKLKVIPWYQNCHEEILAVYVEVMRDVFQYPEETENLIKERIEDIYE